MRKMLEFALIVSMLIVTLWLVASADSTRCTECGMMVDMNSRFTAKLAQRDAVIYFCDIGDLLTYLKRKKFDGSGAEVRDFGTGKWVDARKAFYVQSEKRFKTPMGWGIAAFEGKDQGVLEKVLDFEEMKKALR
jgi:nitrous oxide reductase accessory protein NosL